MDTKIVPRHIRLFFCFFCFLLCWTSVTSKSGRTHKKHFKKSFEFLYYLSYKLSRELSDRQIRVRIVLSQGAFPSKAAADYMMKNNIVESEYYARYEANNKTNLPM